MNAKPKNLEPDQLQRLLEALYGQRAELGDVAAELIALLEAAGVNIPDPVEEPAETRCPNRPGDPGRPRDAPVRRRVRGAARYNRSHRTEFPHYFRRTLFFAALFVGAPFPRLDFVATRRDFAAGFPADAAVLRALPARPRLMRRMIASPNAEQLSSFAPFISRAKS